MEEPTRVEIPLKNRSRYERFERFGRFFLEKTAQTAQILLKKPLKNRSFLAVIFERFFKQDLSGLSGLGGFFWKKPLKPLKSCLKNRSRTAHFLR